MILPIIRELSQLCRVPKLDGEQREKAYGLMRRLREFGFTNHELFVIVGGKISEISIKRNTPGVEVRDMKERDEVIERLTEFADLGYELGDIEGYEKSKVLVDDAGLTFEGCAEFVQNLLLLGVDANGLLRLSDELTGEKLTAKSMRKYIDLNEELAKKRITVETQEEILRAAKKYGEPATILEMVNASGGLMEITGEAMKTADEVTHSRAEVDRVQRGKERLENENLVYRSYIDIVKLLVKKYSFDLISLNELLSLAEKHGNPIQTIRAVNVYHEISALQTRLEEAQTKLRTTEEDLASKETTLRVKEENLAKANQLLGEIRANQSQSVRLQIVSDLINNPREVKATVNELAGICLLVLMGVREYTENNKQESDKFRNKVGLHLKWMIEALQNYQR
jgi:hypothetical protein